MANFIESAGETEPLLESWLTVPSTSRIGYEQRKKVNQSSRFVFPDHGTFLARKIPEPDEVPVMDNPITIALDRCKRLVMRPYSRLLTMIAWQPVFDSPEGTWQAFVNVFHPTVIILLILCGYVIQFAACFRRDQAGNENPGISLDSNGTTVSPTPPSKIAKCQQFAISQYLLPDILHSVAYIYSFVVFRVLKSEQLPTLMERVFLQKSPTQGGFLSQGRLIRRLRLLFWASIMWVVLSQTSLIIHMAAENISGNFNFSWIEPVTDFGRVMLMILMGFSFTVLDVVYVAVVLNYSVQCCLLLSYINGLMEKIREHTLTLETVMKDIATMQEHLRFLNRHPGTAMSIVMINFGTMAITGFLAFIDADSKNFTTLMYISTGASVVLWFTVMAVPVLLAARLTAACNTLRKVGHEIRTRPFGFQDESPEDLDSFLLFTSTLRLKAKLFLIPVRSSYICGVVVLVGVTLMLLFQMGVLHVWL